MSTLAPVFYVLEYSPLVALAGKFMNVVATFIWSYMDLFVMIISIGLSSRFKLVNDYMMLQKGKVKRLFSIFLI
jgi:gustatory receptor